MEKISWCDINPPQNITCDFNNPNTIKTVTLKKDVHGNYSVQIDGDDFWYPVDYNPTDKTFSFKK